MSYQKFSMTLGFLIWLVATLLFRFYGADFFLTEDAMVMGTFYFGIIPLLYLLVNWMFKKYRLSKTDRIRSVVLMILPGMALDTLCIKYYWVVFPAFSQETAVTLGSWVIWVNFIILIIGLLSKEKGE